jgi:hypothetical protein
MIDSVEELAQIHLKNPLHFLSKALFSQVFQRRLRGQSQITDIDDDFRDW